MKMLPRSEVKNLLAIDAAFKYSVENIDAVNMMMVLKAHGYSHDLDAAEYAIWFGEQEMAAQK